MQRSFLGEIRTLRPCAACRGFGSIIPDPCRECSGDGRVRSRRTLTVKIPAGVDTGTRVQLTEQGEVGPGGGPAGDLYVEIHVAPHDTFTRHGNDLHCTVTVPMTAAALGTTLTLPTLEADVDAGRATPASRPPSSSRSGPAPSPAPSRCCAGAACPGCAAAAATWSSRRRRDADPARPAPGGAAPRAGRDPRRGAADRPGAARARSRSSAGSATRSTPALMSLPVHLVPSLAGVAAGASVEVTGDEAHHAVAVRRLRVGESVVLTDGCGRVGDRRGRGDRQAGLRGDRVRRCASLPEPDPAVVVVQALPKGDRGELAVEVLTEIGVAGSCPWAASRSVAVWKGERAAKSLARWRSTAREAAKQARRSWFPRSPSWRRPPTSPRCSRAPTWRVVLHEEASVAAGRRSTCPATGRIVVVVGPEGGLTDDEVAAFVAAGAPPFAWAPRCCAPPPPASPPSPRCCRAPPAGR